jgi:hypothetical protein
MSFPSAAMLLWRVRRTDASVAHLPACLQARLASDSATKLRERLDRVAAKKAEQELRTTELEAEVRPLQPP